MIDQWQLYEYQTERWRLWICFGLSLLFGAVAFTPPSPGLRLSLGPFSVVILRQRPRVKPGCQCAYCESHKK